MNGKQSKLLRKQARTSGVAQETTYTMGVYNTQYFDVLTGRMKSHKVATASMELCQRSVYKALKKEFKRKA